MSIVVLLGIMYSVNADVIVGKHNFLRDTRDSVVIGNDIFVNNSHGVVIIGSGNKECAYENCNARLVIGYGTPHDRKDALVVTKDGDTMVRVHGKMKSMQDIIMNQSAHVQSQLTHIPPPPPPELKPLDLLEIKSPEYTDLESQIINLQEQINDTNATLRNTTIGLVVTLVLFFVMLSAVMCIMLRKWMIRRKISPFELTQASTSTNNRTRTHSRQPNRNVALKSKPANAAKRNSAPVKTGSKKIPFPIKL